MWALLRDGRFGSKVGQIGPKWDKSGAFSDQISVHFGSIELKSDLKKSRICPIWGQSDLLWSQTYHPWHHHNLRAAVPVSERCCSHIAGTRGHSRPRRGWSSQTWPWPPRPRRWWQEGCTPSREHSCLGKSQIVSDWPQMGQIWDFLISVSEHFSYKVPDLSYLGPTLTFLGKKLPFDCQKIAKIWHFFQ